MRDEAGGVGRREAILYLDVGPKALTQRCDMIRYGFQRTHPGCRVRGDSWKEGATSVPPCRQEVART